MRSHRVFCVTLSVFVNASIFVVWRLLSAVSVLFLSVLFCLPLTSTETHKRFSTVCQEAAINQSSSAAFVIQLSQSMQVVRQTQPVALQCLATMCTAQLHHYFMCLSHRVCDCDWQMTVFDINQFRRDARARVSLLFAHSDVVYSDLVRSQAFIRVLHARAHTTCAANTAAKHPCQSCKTSNR